MRKLLKRTGVAIAAFVIAGGLYLAITGVPAPPSIKAEGIPRVPWAPIGEAASFVKNGFTGQALLDWYPSGEGIVVRAGGLRDSTLYRVLSPGAEPAKLLSLSADSSDVVLNPNPGKNLLVYAEDDRGNEFRQLFLYDLATKSTRRLTDDKANHHGAVFDRAGARLAFLATDRNSNETTFNVIDPLQRSSLRTVCRAPGNWGLGAWSPDGQQIHAWKPGPLNNTFLYALDLRNGELRRLGSGEEGHVRHRSAQWSHDGRYVYYVGDWKSEFSTLRRVEFASGKEEELTGDVPWDVAAFDISADDSTLSVVFNEDGWGRLYLLDAKTYQRRPVPGISTGSVTNPSFHPTSGKLAWTLVRLDGIGSVGSFDLDSGRTIEWTKPSGAASTGHPEPRLIHYPTFDQVDGKARMIPAWLWQAQVPNGKPTPVLVNIHGGPDGQSGPINVASGLLAGHGISEIQPNVRGSTGYGKEYRGLDNGRHRMDAVKDIGALLDWIGTQPTLDSKRVAIFGASYGGFMALASAVEFSDRLACGIDFFGISDFENMIRDTRTSMRDWARSEFGDERDPDMRRFLHSISPLENQQRIKIPFFIFQGANDTRVSAGESRRMAAKLRGRGQNVWYIEAADQGHSMPNPINSLFVLPAGLTFLDRCLLEGKPSLNP